MPQQTHCRAVFAGVHMLPCYSTVQELYSSVAWPLYKLHGHAFDAFKLMVQVRAVRCCIY